MSLRKEFEKWYCTKVFDFKYKDKETGQGPGQRQKWFSTHYEDKDIQLAWLSYQAGFSKFSNRCMKSNKN